MNASGFNRKFIAALALLVILLILSYVAAVTFIPMPQSGIKYADMAVPFLLGSGFGAVVGFFFHQQSSAPTYPQPTKVDVKP